MVFVADDLGAWLVGLLADAGRKKLIALVLGSDQERALRKAAAAAVQEAAADMSTSVEHAGQLAMVISEVFREPVPGTPLAGPVTMLEGLQAGIVRQLAVLDDAVRTGTGQASAEILGVSGTVVAEKLTGHLVREIMFRGSGGGPLAPLADQLNHDLTHLQGQRVEGMLARLAAMAIAVPTPSSGGGGPARSIEPARPAGALRVTEADPRRLGVHAAISVPGLPDEVPPEYVPRDVDDGESGVRATVAAAARRGGFVLLVGGSSVGKTRCAFEALTALLPDWWLVHPAGSAEVAALAATPTARTVVWLDELQRYLDGEHGLTGGVMRALLNAPHPAVIIGTIWPDWYTAYTTMPFPASADPHSREREVLDLAAVIRVDPEFTPAEQDRARAAAVRDRRLRVALESARYGLTQTLAAAPQLVARWEDAKTANPYAWAVLTAALDAARLGARAPLSADFLRAAAPGYCTSQQQAEAPENWFEQALDHATGKLHGAAAALSPAGAGMGQLAGYIAADYLIQHAHRQRRYARMPASAWDAVLNHVHDPADTARLADSARNRLLYRYAIPLYRHAVDAGDQMSAWRLADLLQERGDLDGAVEMLLASADPNVGSANMQLVELLAERGDLDGLRTWADTGDWAAALRLAGLLAERGDLDGLRAWADAGNWIAAWRLAGLLAGWGDLDELRARADARDWHAAWQLADLLAKRGDLDGAEQILRAQTDTGDGPASAQLADLLAKRGDLDEAKQILQTRVGNGDQNAALQLADLRGDLDGAVEILRAGADADDPSAAKQLAERLAERGDLDELRARANAGDGWAERTLAELLAERSDLDELRARADAGDLHAAGQLADLLTERGDLDGLRAWADTGDWHAALKLARLLAERSDLDELRARADAGDWHAAWQLADLLVKHGHLNEAEQILRALADAGDWPDAGQLAELLADLLKKQGRGEEAKRLRRFGLNSDGSIACA